MPDEEPLDVSPGDVRVEVVDLAAGNRQIARHRRRNESWADRKQDVQHAIGQALGAVTESLDRQPASERWAVRSVDVVFGVTLTADAGVIISRADAEATLEVTLRIAPR